MLQPLAKNVCSVSFVSQYKSSHTHIQKQRSKCKDFLGYVQAYMGLHTCSKISSSNVVAFGTLFPIMSKNLEFIQIQL